MGLFGGGGGGGGGGDTLWEITGADGINQIAPRIWWYGPDLTSSIGVDGGIYLVTVGDGVEVQLDAEEVLKLVGGGGIRLTNRSSDPSSPNGNGQMYYHSTDTHARLYRDDVWTTLLHAGDIGAATITSGNTSVVVPHAAGEDPIDAKGVLVWPTNNPTNDPGWFWVSGVGFDEFTINVRSNPGASGASFAWMVGLPR